MLACLSLLSLNSCSTLFRSARDAAIEVWKEKSPEIIGAGAEAAKKYWEANSDKIVDMGKDAAAKAGAAALKEAQEYTDKKMAEAKEKTLTKLYAAGYTKAQMDSDANGEVSDDELMAFMKANPMTFWYAGASGLALYAMWLMKQRLGQKPAVVSSPPAPPAQP